MRVSLLNAVSLDGFIADAAGRTDWVRDLEEWEEAVKDFRCMIVGRKTHDEVGVIEGATSFIYTHQPKSFTASPSEIYVGDEPADVIKQVSDAGFKQVLLVGGAETNSAFARAGLIDELILDIHPIVLGQGKKLLGDCTKSLKLELISSQQNPKGYVKNHYRIQANN